MTLAFAPYRQFYLAWVGLIPWLHVVRTSKSHRRAFFWSWLAGTAFFAANMWWLYYVTIPGMIALLVYLGLYWGLVAWALRGIGWNEVSPRRHILLGTAIVAIVWTSFEWIRGTLFTGLPWLYVGHTQTPLINICQIADIFGVYGVTFVIVAINAAIYLGIIQLRDRWWALGTVVVLFLVTLGYGHFRRVQTARLALPGLRILVVQPNYPQDNSSGNKSASEDQIIDFHLSQTAEAIRSHGPVDLAVWSETMMPPLNEEYRMMWRGFPAKDKDGKIIDEDRGATLDKIVLRISTLCKSYHVNLLTGGLFNAGYNEKTGYFEDRRNTAFLFRTNGTMDFSHYDKIHLVPFGEFVPFKNWWGLRWMHGIFMKLSPYDFDYTLTAGSASSPTVFRLNKEGIPGARIITPICFEDIDPALCAKMLRSPQGKRADVLVNLTNDGWFRANENAQHLQASVFRAIENRVPLARSVNTGISAIIDSFGHVVTRVPVRTEGVAVADVKLDSRYTIYTRIGDLFAWLCTLITAVLVIPAIAGWWKYRRQSRAVLSPDSRVRKPG